MQTIEERDRFFMQQALQEAKRETAGAEVPVGAVLVLDSEIIASGHNLVERLVDSSAHAEMLCLRAAAKFLRNWRLLGTTLYVTLEPCVMCAGAMFSSRIQRVVWGAPDKRLGANGSWCDLFALKHPMHRITVTSGVLAEECGSLLKTFFADVRRAK